MYLFEENKIDFLHPHIAVLKKEIDAILNTAGTSAILLNRHLEIQFFSKGVGELYQISEDDLGKKISDIPGYFADCDVTHYCLKILEQNVGFRGKITTSKGRHYMKRMAPFKTDERGIIGIIIAFTDITDLENAQMALELSESRFRDMAEVAVDYFFELAKDGTIVYVSPSMKESLGYEKEDVLGRKIAEFMPPKEAPIVIKHAIKHTQTSDTYPPVTHHVIKKDGSQIIVEARGKVIRNKNGEVIGYRAINRNITDRISTEREQEHLNRLLEQKVFERTRELEEKQHQLEEAQRVGRVGSWVWNPNNGYLMWSDMMYEIFDIDPLNNEGFEDFKSRVHPNDLGYIMQKEEDAIQQGDSDYQAEFRIIRRSGEIRYINANVQIKRNEEGKVLKLIGTAQDVTLVKQQVEERRKLINDLLNQNKELQQFNYIVSHNLRSPVANLIGLAKLYRKGETSERNDKIIENILQSAESIDLVLKDLSQILQMRGDISLEREMVNIHDVLSTVLKTIAPQMESMEVEIKTDFSAASEIFTVKSYLNSILYNLISNAIKYRHPDRKCLIEMETGKTENYFYLHVRDNGIGFDTEKNKEKLFGLYKRFHSHVEGKGIGLYLVKVQAETLGGWVEVESEVDKGTVFTVFISINS